MFKIGDFSRLGQVSVRMLRHYDKLGLLTPNQIDQYTGYRYYTVEQLARLNRIVALNDMGLTLQQISHLLGKGQDLPAEQLRGMLRLRQAAIEQELEDKQFQLTRVEARLNQIEQEGTASPYEVVVKAIDGLTVASFRQPVPAISQMGHYCQMMYQQLHVLLDEYDITGTGQELTLYHNEEYVEVDLDVETAVSVEPGMDSRLPANAPFSVHQIPAAPLAATVVHEGSYHDVTHAVFALLTWSAQHSYAISGPLRELHLSGPAHVNGRVRESAVIEFQLPLQKPL